MVSMGDMPTISEADVNSQPIAKKQPHRWRPGESGNPAGKARGSRNRASILAETLLDGETGRLTRQCIDMALNGDVQAMRLCLELVLAPIKSRPFTYRLPVLETVADATAALSRLVAGVSSGEILSDEAQTLSNVIHTFLKSVEVAPLEERLAALEQASAEARPEVRFNA
jgi:Family of unknown function (DUF5681)